MAKARQISTMYETDVDEGSVRGRHFFTRLERVAEACILRVVDMRHAKNH